MYSRTFLFLIAALSVCLFSILTYPAYALAKGGHTKKIERHASAGILVHYEQRPEVVTFINEMVAKHDFIAEELTQLFAQTRYLPVVARLVTPSGSTKPKRWTEYRARFIEAKRIEGGIKFWQENAAILALASKQYGIPAEIIVAIVGVETIYGRNVGYFRVIDALTTLSFDYPTEGNNRSGFFREQLEEYLLFVREAGLNVFGIRGSYAGAMGLPQFMPGSWRHYGVDYDHDGKIDLLTNNADVIGSIANFLHQHGWKSQQPTHFLLPLTFRPTASFNVAGIEPRWTLNQLHELGILLGNTGHSELEVALVDLPDPPNPPVYVLGTQNFYTITRYNRSSFYAMAVIELAQTIRERYVQYLANTKANSLN